MRPRELFTVGYEGSDIADLLLSLRVARVGTVIDVRELPLSRKPGFSKGRLSEALENCGIRYVHLRGLGDPKPGRVAAGDKRFGDFRRIFHAHMQTAPARADLRHAIQY